MRLLLLLLSAFALLLAACGSGASGDSGATATPTLCAAQMIGDYAINKGDPTRPPHYEYFPCPTALPESTPIP